MANSVMQKFKKLFWYSIATSTFEDTRVVVLNDETFLRDVKNGRNATIHLPKKHLPPVVRKTVNDILKNQQYAVTSMKYRFYGMDVVVSRK